MAFADFEQLLKEAMGLDAASIGASAIERAVTERTAACGLSNSSAYWQRVRTSADELQALIEAVVVSETWFFRDPEAFSTLVRLVHERSLTAQADGVYRVLSLPSSTGEEPYSIAMALFDTGMPANRFAVEAIDISAQAIARAERAIYGKNSFRGRELQFRARHFDAAAGGYRLNDRVRRQVRFRQANLFARDAFASTSYDAIFCRNLLIYFDRATQERAIRVLDRQLAPSGVLFVAPSETGVLLNHGFVPVKAPFAFAFRKAGEAARERKPHLTKAPGHAAVQPIPAAIVRFPSPLRSDSPAHPALASTADLRAAAGTLLEEAAELANRGCVDEAFERCEEHLRLSGPSAEAFQLMGLVREAGGDPAEAERCYRKALYLDPNHRDVLVHLALLLENVGKTAEAQLLRKRANRLPRQNGPHDAPAV